MLWERLLLSPGGEGAGEGGTHSRQNQPLDRWHPSLLAQSSQGPRSPTPSFSTSVLSPPLL